MPPLLASALYRYLLRLCPTVRSGVHSYLILLIFDVVTSNNNDYGGMIRDEVVEY
jgi:hypothetical protein